MKWNSHRKTLRVGGVTKPDVAAFLANGQIAKFPESKSEPEMTGSLGLIV